LARCRGGWHGGHDRISPMNEHAALYRRRPPALYPMLATKFEKFNFVA
jgi:hypothetical protein